MNSGVKSKLISDDPTYTGTIDYIRNNKSSLPEGTIIDTARRFCIESHSHASRVIAGKASATKNNIAFLLSIYGKVKECTERLAALTSQAHS